MTKGLSRCLKRLMVRLASQWASDGDTALHWLDYTFQRLERMKQLGFAPEVILDVGASEGRWTRQCLKVFPTARYFLIDPLLENEASLGALSREVPQVKYRLCLVGPQQGQAILNVDGSGSSVLRGHWDNPYGEQRQVPMETLDSLLAVGWLTPPQLIKLDVQGYELEVLKGAERVLPTVATIVTEISFFPFHSGMPIFHQVVDFLFQRGFVCYDVLNLSPRPLDGALAQADLLFLREDNPLRASNRWAIDSTY